MIKIIKLKKLFSLQKNQKFSKTLLIVTNKVKLFSRLYKKAIFCIGNLCKNCGLTKYWAPVSFERYWPKFYNTTIKIEKDDIYCGVWIDNRRVLSIPGP